ncbi:hypothetical protein I5080_13845 [Salmonella enterica]|nr:hypothetical protein I5080_13845 [Salmonella enterica]
MTWALGQQNFAVAFNDGGNNIKFFLSLSLRSLFLPGSVALSRPYG